MSSATTKWIALALLGLAIAAGVAFLATRLASEQIGIASESISAGYDLAPAVNSATATPGGNDASAQGQGDGATRDDAVQNVPPDATSTETPSTGGNDGVDPDRLEDEIEDREKEREDALDNAADEREDREDEIRDLEEDRRDD